jgi:hypothetical protein
MDEIKRWEEVLQQAHAKAEAGGADAEEAKVDAQFAADEIRRLQGIQQSYNTPEEGGKAVTDVIARPVAGVVTTGFMGTKELAGVGAQKFAEMQARENAKAMLDEQAKRTQSERMLQGTIDPETGATGRSRMVGYNEATSEQAKAKAANQPVLESLKRQGVITGENPLLKNPGYTASTPSGISVRPEILQKPPTPPVSTAAEPSLIDMLKTRTMNVAKDVSSLPTKALEKLIPYAAAYGVGSQGMDTINRGWNRDAIGALISALGTYGAYTATKPGGLVPGGLTSLTAEAINYYRDHPEEFVKLMERTAGGGLPIGNDNSTQRMAEGGQPDPIPIQKNNPMVEREAQKALTEIAKRKALYEIGQIAEQERAKQVASRARPNNLYPGTGTLEPSGNGGPMLNNPLNR